MKDWTRYYDAAGVDPRETLLDALARFDEPGFAVDLGCGTGRDTFELLRRGWRVLAIDAQDEALRRVRAAVGGYERLDEEEEDSTTVVGDAKHWHLFHVVARKR